MKRFTWFFLLAVITTNGLADPRLWGPQGVTLQRSARIEWQQAVSCNTADEALVAWSDMHTGNREIYAQLIGADDQPAWVDPVQITNEPHEQSFPVVAATVGGWIIGWLDYRDNPRRYDGTMGGDVYAQKINSQGQVLWTPGGTVVNASTEIQRGTLFAASDDAGGAVLSWIDESRTLRAMRVMSDGTNGWTDLAGIFTSGSDSYQFRCASDGSGGLIAAWVVPTPYEFDVFASRISVNGEQLWGSSVTVCNRAYNQQEVNVCPDNAGGAYVTWVTSANGDGNNTDIWSQHLNPSGQAQWAANGIPVCEAPYSQYSPSVTASTVNGSGDGCILAWTDMRDPYGQSAYYSQKLNADGTPQWATNGIFLCDSADSGELTLLSDSQGGLVTAFNGWRGLSALHLNANGQSVWSPRYRPVINLQYGFTAYQVLPVSNGILIAGLNSDWSSQTQSLRDQKLDWATGAQLLPAEGIALVIRPFGDSTDPQAVPMAGGRTAVFSPWTRFIILNSGGQREITPDSLIQLPDTVVCGGLEVSALSPDGNGGFFAATQNGYDEIGYRSFLSHITAAGELVNDNPTEIWPAGLGDYVAHPVVSSDNQGGVYVGFQAAVASLHGMYLLRFDSNCQPIWSDPVFVDSTGLLPSPSLITQPNDDVMMLLKPWDYYQPPDTILRVARITPGGMVLWNVGICDSSAHAEQPILLADGQDGAYVLWATNWTTSRLFAQHVGGNGESMWPAIGLRISITEARQIEPGATVDASGNLLVAWSDQSDPTNENIYAQKITPGGQRMWSDEGRLICDAPFGQFSPHIIPDGADGCFVSWMDYRYYGPDLYATHLDSTGNAGADPYWVSHSGGLISDSAMEVLDYPVLVPGPDGSAVAFWLADNHQSDSRAIDLYAQRFTAFNLSSPEPSRPSPLSYSLEQNFPNPFNSGSRIEFTLPQAGHVSIRVFDITGRTVATLMDQEVASGAHHVLFTTDALSSGVYFYRMTSGDFSMTRKMVLLK